MVKLLTLLASLIGLVGLVFCIWLIGVYTHPSISLAPVVVSSLVGYTVMIMLMTTGSTLIELLVIILMITVILLIALLASGDLLSADVRLVGWSMLCAAWYMPVFVLSLGHLLGEDEATGETQPKTSGISKALEKQKLIEKSLRRRKRKQARRKNH
ncbi:MAG: hypothetical protein OQL16_02465 [Gammaproteobacteria bacterium]|nr:hypothetical protein [Gammaproteobacteria bacterium]